MRVSACLSVFMKVLSSAFMFVRRWWVRALWRVSVWMHVWTMSLRGGVGIYWRLRTDSFRRTSMIFTSDIEVCKPVGTRWVHSGRARDIFFFWPLEFFRSAPAQNRKLLFFPFILCLCCMFCWYFECTNKSRPFYSSEQCSLLLLPLWAKMTRILKYF